MSPKILSLTAPAKFFILRIIAPDGTAKFIALDSEGDYSPSECFDTSIEAKEELETMRQGECLSRKDAY